MRMNHRVPADGMTPDSVRRARAGRLDALNAEAYRLSDLLSLLCIVVLGSVFLGLAFWPVLKGFLTEFVWGVVTGVGATLFVAVGLLLVGAMIGVQRTAERT